MLQIVHRSHPQQKYLQFSIPTVQYFIGCCRGYNSIIKRKPKKRMCIPEIVSTIHIFVCGIKCCTVNTVQQTILYVNLIYNSYLQLDRWFLGFFRHEQEKSFGWDKDLWQLKSSTHSHGQWRRFDTLATIALLRIHSAVNATEVCDPPSWCYND